ncbi:DHS-like NAD/FAD-binding domain-containing protein [Mycena alexandri]|uniref:DHS-like NAD/FAD-binding domain-containing protein n=1 Tax=Mycena alexandri TaxID=1745969 RepID=A0AAD6TCR5_9AGAR|nr:DHS-like NAD/FAD-binding domain-containing protein [Mycena alexandri]
MSIQTPHSGPIGQPLTEASSGHELHDPEATRALPSLQIRAFLAASEDIDIDPETVEELVQALILETTSSDTDNTNSSILVSESNSPEPDGFDLEVSELDMSALYFPLGQDVQTWSQQQIRGMMHHLKEHGMSSWMNEYVLKRNIPVPQLLLAFGINLDPSLHEMSPATLTYFLRVAMSRELQLRDKLPNYNTVEDAVRLIRESKRILILTGAGISVSCGIPDFRSRNGLYASLKLQGEYDLDDPQQMFDINYFRENPAVFYSFASRIYPSNFVPSPCHRFIKLVENRNQLLRNYTQNIDTIETLAGVTRVVQCHGSFATASCLLCRRQVPGSDIEDDILAQKVPLCSVCNAPQLAPLTGKRKSRKKSAKKAKGGWDSEDEDESDGPAYPPGIMKPDITFFGEKLTDNFDHSLAADRSEVDLLLVIGTSLKVSPVADILCHLPHSVPQILINKTPVRHINPDIILLGNSDDIIAHLCNRLGWELPPPKNEAATAPEFLRDAKKRSVSDLHAHEEPHRVGQSHIWLFEGAEGGEWLENIEQQISSSPTEQSPKKPRLE